MNLLNIYKKIRTYYRETVTAELSNLSRFFDKVVVWKPLPWDTQELSKNLISNTDAFEKNTLKSNERTLFILNGHLNYADDIHTLLNDLTGQLSRFDRAACVVFNPYLAPLFSLFSRLKIISSPAPYILLRSADLENMSRLWGFHITRIKPFGYLPFRLWGIANLINKFWSILPILRWCSIGAIVIIRSTRQRPQKFTSAVIIPARNESGNISLLFEAINSDLSFANEIIFVEGNSTDQTWDEIQKHISQQDGTLNIRLFKQTGKGKADAVRCGILQADSEVMLILDADLTVAPNTLHLFLNAYQTGAADFINGHRLLLPQEEGAMRHLNWLGNIFFALFIRFITGLQTGDSLCGTKAFLKKDFERFMKIRDESFIKDPFGDFDLILPVGEFGIGSVDVAVSYRSRKFGTTNIRRFRDGFQLFLMLTEAWWKINSTKLHK